MPKPEALDPMEELRELSYRRRRENRLKTMQFFKTERDVYAKEEWGPWFEKLVSDRLLIRKMAIVNAWTPQEYKLAVYKWYRSHGFTEPPKKPHGKRIASPWKALAHYQKEWREDNPTVPTTPPPPVLTTKQIEYHEEWFRKRYKERLGKI